MSLLSYVLVSLEGLLVSSHSSVEWLRCRWISWLNRLLGIVVMLKITNLSQFHFRSLFSTIHIITRKITTSKIQKAIPILALIWLGKHCAVACVILSMWECILYFQIGHCISRLQGQFYRIVLHLMPTLYRVRFKARSQIVSCTWRLVSFPCIRVVQSSRPLSICRRYCFLFDEYRRC